MTLFTNNTSGSGVPYAIVRRSSFISNDISILSVVIGTTVVGSGNRNEQLVRRNNVSLGSMGMASMCTALAGTSFSGSIVVGGNGGIFHGFALWCFTKLASHVPYFFIPLDVYLWWCVWVCLWCLLGWLNYFNVVF